MKKQFTILRTDLQPGDLTITSNPGNPWISVEREVPMEFKVGMLITTEEELVAAPERSIMLDRDEDVWVSKGYGDWQFDGDRRNATDLVGTSFAPFTLIHVGGTEVAEPGPVAPAKPQITWEYFINTMNQTVADNDLHVGGDFERAIVFAADRLGFR